MIRLDEVRDRCIALVPALEGRMGNAGQFTQMIQRNQLPQVTPAGYVLPGGLQGGQVVAMTGRFVQGFVETVKVVLAARVAGDPTGAAGLDELTPLIRTIVNGFVGWVPNQDSACGPMQLVSGEVTGSDRDVFIYEIDFAFSDQLRTNPS